MRSIKIERLEIRLKDISPQVARSSVEGLGHELLRQLAEQKVFLKQKRTTDIGKIDSGTFQASGDTSYSDLRKLIAGRVVESIISKTK